MFDVVVGRGLKNHEAEFKLLEEDMEEEKIVLDQARPDEVKVRERNGKERMEVVQCQHCLERNESEGGKAGGCSTVRCGVTCS